MTKKKSIGRIVGILVSVVILALVAGLMIPAGDGLSILGVRFYAVLTQSMSPTINAGSMIMVRRADPADIVQGDVITFHPLDGAETLVTHRVTAVEQTENGPLFTTRGDANNTDDVNPVRPEQVLGRTVFWIGGLGFLTTSLRPLVIAVLVVLIIVWILFNILGGKDEEKKESEPSKT